MLLLPPKGNKNQRKRLHPLLLGIVVDAAVFMDTMENAEKDRGGI
jgi:hypothetical protein